MISSSRIGSHKSFLLPEGAQTPVPAAPGSVSAAPGDTSASVTFGSVSGAVSYNLYYSTVHPVTLSSTKVAGVTSPKSVTSLTNGTLYYFAVTTVNGGGESVLSSEVSTTPAVAVPGNVAASAGDTQVTITWDAVGGASSYNLYYSTTSPVTTGSTKVTGVTSPKVVSALTDGTAYYFRVTAVSGASESALSSEVSATPAVPGYSLSFASASTQYMTADTMLDNAVPMSISMWTKHTTAPGMVVSKLNGTASSPGWAIYRQGTSNPYFLIQQDGSTWADCLSSITVNDGAWHHVVVTMSARSSAGMKIYVDGVEDLSATRTQNGTVSSFANGDVVHLGTDTALQVLFNGKIADVRGWTSVLSAANVATLYAGGTVAGGLVFQWLASDGSGTTVTDNSGNGHTGTLVNGVTWSADFPY